MFVPETVFRERIAPAIEDEIFLSLWYLVLDGSAVTTTSVDRLQSGVTLIERQLDTLLPTVRVSIAPCSITGGKSAG